jgi:hypothetical protein
MGRIGSETTARLGANSAFISLFAIGAILRLFVWLAYQPAILILADSYYYLRAGVGNTVGSDRPFLYSLIVIKPLLSLGGLALVTGVQHLVGLAMGAGLYAFQRRLGVHPSLAAIGASLVLLDGYQLDIEQHILTEAVFEGFIVGGFLTLLWWRKPPAWVYLSGGILLGMSAITRFVGLALFPVALIFLILSRVGWIRLCAAVAGFFVPILLYSSFFQGGTGRASVKDQVAVRVYGKVASLADCSHVVLPPVERQLCVKKPASERQPYYSFWGNSPYHHMKVPTGTDKRAVVASFDKRFIVLQPLDYVAAVTRDFLKFFSWSSVQDIARSPVRRWEFFMSRRAAFNSPQRVATAARFRQSRGSPPPELGLEEHFRLEPGVARKLRAYQSIVYARGPLLALLALLGISGALLGKENLSGDRSSARVDCLLLATSGLSLFLFPALFTRFHFRYVIPSLPLLGPAGAIGLSLLLVRVTGPRGPNRFWKPRVGERC